MTIEPNDNEIKRDICGMNAGIFKLKKSKKRAFTTKQIQGWRKHYIKLRRFIKRLQAYKHDTHQNSR